MKNIFKKITLVTFVTLFMCTGYSLHAQEFSPIAELAQQYVERIADDLNKIDGTIMPSNTVIVNPEAVERDAVSESINTISKTIEEVGVEKTQVITDIKESVKEDIDNSIILIRKTTEKPAYELQKAIDIDRTELFENISQTIDSINPIETQKITQLQSQVDVSLEKIQTSLETESGLPVDFEKSKRDIRNTLLNFEKILLEKQSIIESRQGALVFEDTDMDGISDYDEIYVYKTDPDKIRTTGSEGMTDGEKIQAGINPLSDQNDKITYQDPREDKTSFVSSSYKVDKIQLIKDSSALEKLVFEGSALPNTFITLYIYSTPIVVTVKTSESGQWSYELEKELENGEHQIFVATVDTSGKIIARSSPIIFTKSAEAATIGIAGSLDTSINTQNFLKDNFILITLATLISVVILGMMFVGDHKNIRSAVTELKNEVNTKY